MQGEQQVVPLQYDEKTSSPQNLSVHSYESPYTLHQVMSKKLSSEGLVVRYDPQNQYLAVGARNGDILLYNVDEKKIAEKYHSVSDNSVTTVKWRPLVNTNVKTLVTADSEGSLEYFHIPTMKKLFFMREQANTINSLDFNRTATMLATAGKDCNVRIYDEQTKSLVKMCRKADWNHTGHDNRIFAVKFIDDNTLITGGWDAVIHIWDVRTEKSIRHMYGANISGEALDFQDGKILAGCYAVNNQVQVWDFNKATKIETIDWTHDIDVAAYVYAACYSRYDIGLIGSGSTGAQSSIKLFKDLDFSGKHKLINEIKGVDQGCFSFDFSHKSSQFAFTTAHHGFFAYDYRKDQ